MERGFNTATSGGEATAAGRHCERTEAARHLGLLRNILFAAPTLRSARDHTRGIDVCLTTRQSEHGVHVCQATLHCSALSTMACAFLATVTHSHEGMFPSHPPLPGA